VSGMALLAFIALWFQGLPQIWLQMIEALRRWLIIGEASNAQHRSSPHSHGARRAERVASAWRS